MQYSTFAAIDIGSYDVILEIFEISKKQGIRSVDKICHRMELGKDTYTLGKIRRPWPCRRTSRRRGRGKSDRLCKKETAGRRSPY